MKRLISLIARPGLTGLFLVFSLILAACSAPAAAKNSPTVAPAAGGETVQVANNAKFGQVLVTTDGKALYTNTIDTPEASNCTNVACTGFWPPYTIDGQPTAGQGIPGTVGTITRPDGTKQVTYNQRPVYTFYQDRQPGDVGGDGFSDSGGTWHVVVIGSSPAGGGSSNTSSTGGDNSNGGYGGYPN